MLRILEYKCDYNSVVKTAEGGGAAAGARPGYRNAIYRGI